MRRLPASKTKDRVAGIFWKVLWPRYAPIATAPMRIGYEVSVDLRSFTEGPSFYTGDFDTEDIESISKLASPVRPWIAADVGANVGFWSVPLAQLAKRSGGRIHAFEPVFSNFKKLSENIHNNNLAEVTTLHNIGLSDRHHTATISLREDFTSGSETGNAAIVIDADDSQFQCIEIELRTLDDVLTDEALDFLKLDIEGHEDKFLKGAERTIQRCQPVIYMEVNDDYYLRRGIDPTQLFTNWMTQSGYASAIGHIRRGRRRWLPQPLSSRRPGIDNVLLIPRSRVSTVLEQLNS